MSHKRRVIIQTRAHAILSDVARQVVDGAGLALVKGPVGVGKTFALDLICDALTADGVRVIRVTSTPAIEGSIAAFLNEALGSMAGDSPSTLDKVDTLWRMLSGFPFGPFKRPELLIADEAQGLKGSILELIRSLWDRGESARAGDDSRPAFGCMLVGNSTFLGKGGNQRVASFKPLLSRVTHNVTLPGPAKAEIASLAAELFPAPQDHELFAMIEAAGVERGNLRVMAIAARQFQARAGLDMTTEDRAALLRSILRMMGGA